MTVIFVSEWACKGLDRLLIVFFVAFLQKDEAEILIRSELPGSDLFTARL